MTENSLKSTGRTRRVTLVTMPGCHLCRDASETLEQLSHEFPLEVRIVQAESAEGRALIARHRPALQPLVLLEGEAFSAGRLPRRKLRRALDRMLEAG